MFGFGRKKSRFTERYNRIGAGQRIGDQPTDADQSDLDLPESPAGASVGPDADAVHALQSTADIVNPVELYQDEAIPAAGMVADQAGDDGSEALADAQAEPEAVPQTDVQLIAPPQAMDAGSGPADPGQEGQASDAVQDPQLPRIHASGHDTMQWENGLPSWLESFDPAEPPQTQRAGTAGEAPGDAAEAGLAGAAASMPRPAPKRRGPIKREPEPKKAEPPPAWLDIAEEVESRPPPMPFGGEPELPDDEDATPDKVGSRETAFTAAGPPETGRAESGEPEANSGADETGLQDEVQPVAQAAADPGPHSGIVVQQAANVAGEHGHARPVMPPAATAVDAARMGETSQAEQAPVVAARPVPLKAAPPPMPLPPPL